MLLKNKGFNIRVRAVIVSMSELVLINNWLKPFFSWELIHLCVKAISSYNSGVIL